MTGCARPGDPGLPASRTDHPPTAHRRQLVFALALEPAWAHPTSRSPFACTRSPPAGAPQPRVAPALGGWRLMGPKSLQGSFLTMAALGTERGPPISGPQRKKGAWLRAPGLWMLRPAPPSSALSRLTGTLSCHLLVGGQRSGAWEPLPKKRCLPRASSSPPFRPPPSSVYRAPLGRLILCEVLDKQR